jgi:nucleotide-binding universal stress UspA family protein
MGTHGTSRLEDLLFGSVTEKVVHHTGCPVLVVPPRTEAA